ncbi:MAG: MBOAT family protein [Muribaculaceae bacterium]|nr:MBOAT family protein [Muribaculaceae bacterium]
MAFNSVIYALFLPVVFLLYWYVFARKLRIQNVFLLIASYAFYACWDWRFLALIIFTTLSTFLTAKRAVKGRRRFWTGTNIVANLAILFVFKYFNFFAESFSQMMSAIGWEVDAVTLNVVLPVGISFYTFQALGYSIDVARGQIKPTDDIVSFATFIAFFPQLVAGPIERASSLLPQIERERRFDYAEAVLGMRQILWGVVKKVAVADVCAVYVDRIFSQPDMYASEFGASTLVLGAVLFAFQIYGDFSGYSDIAIGSARLLGIRLRQNFRYPYFSRSVADFWGRWHISLTSWFRDYVYIPLGGNRRGKGRTYFNIIVVFLLSGLWHGANFTFIAWGAMWGVAYVVERMIFGKVKYTDEPRLRNILPMLGIFIVAVIGFAIFRSPSISFFGHYASLCASSSLFAVPSGLTAMAYVVPFIVIEWFGRKHDFAIESLSIPAWARYLFYTFLLMVILFANSKPETFIYFQF